MEVLFQVKICGITSPNDARVVCEAGADAIGINFYPRSPRFVDHSNAVKIANAVRDFNADTQSSVQTVGVFVNGNLENVLRILGTCSLDMVQFHGDEKPEIIARFHEYLLKAGLFCKTLRAIRTKSRKPVRDAGVDEANRVSSELKAWIEAGVDGILLDAAVPGEFGGTGATVDWSVVPRLECQVPLILAGGLRYENVAEAIRIAQITSVDVASGVESSPGVKDPELVRKFVQRALSAW